MWQAAGLRIGTDIVSVARIADVMERHGDSFAARWFTTSEIAYCTSKAFPDRHFAARLAAKESVLKALPIEWSGPIPWRSIEIVLGEGGAPSAQLSGDLALAADRAGVRAVSVTMSHCDDYATATALTVSEPAMAVGLDSEQSPGR